MIKLILITLALVGTTATPDALSRVMRTKLTYPSSRGKKPVYVRHCRIAPAGCDARIDALARYFMEAGETHDIDPWLLAAMAVRESGLNPFAQGRGGELGLLQIHPKNRHAKRIRFTSDPKYRQRCRKEVGACQREVVLEAAKILRGSIDKCGNVAEALGMYNTGRCTKEAKYVRLVTKTRAILVRWSEEHP